MNPQSRYVLLADITVDGQVAIRKGNIAEVYEWSPSPLFSIIESVNVVEDIRFILYKDTEEGNKNWSLPKVSGRRILTAAHVMDEDWFIEIPEITDTTLETLEKIGEFYALVNPIIGRQRRFTIVFGEKGDKLVVKYGDECIYYLHADKNGVVMAGDGVQILSRPSDEFITLQGLHEPINNGQNHAYSLEGFITLLNNLSYYK